MYSGFLVTEGGEGGSGWVTKLTVSNNLQVLGDDAMTVGEPKVESCPLA